MIEIRKGWWLYKYKSAAWQGRYIDTPQLSSQKRMELQHRDLLVDFFP